MSLGKNHLKHKYYKNEKVFLETFGIKYDLLDSLITNLRKKYFYTYNDLVFSFNPKMLYNETN